MLHGQKDVEHAYLSHEKNIVELSVYLSRLLLDMDWTNPYLVLKSREPGGTLKTYHEFQYKLRSPSTI